MKRIMTNFNDLRESANGQVPELAADRRRQLFRTLFEVDLLEDSGLKPAESIPSGMLGGAMEQMVNAVADRLQTPNGLAAACSLATVSTALGSGLFVASRPGMFSYSNIYILAGTESGGFKSITAAPILKPLTDLHQERISQWRSRDYPRLMAEKDSLDAERKRLLRSKSNAAPPAGRLQDIYGRLKKMETELLEPRLYGENATTEAVAQQMSVNKGKYAIITPDGRDQIGIFSGKYRKPGETDEALYLKAWSNESYDSPRIGRKVEPMQFTYLTQLLLTQPDMVSKMFSTTAFTEGGLLPRFLTLMADYPPKELRRGDTEPPDTISPTWDRFIREIFEAYHDAKPRRLQIGAEAIAVLDAHYNSIVVQYKSLKPIWVYASRWTEQAWRLTIILHAALYGRKAHLEPIQVDTAKAAVAIADWFRGHQLAILEESQTMRLSELIQSVLELFKTPEVRKIIATDLTRKRIVPSAEKAKALLEWMCPEYLMCKTYTPESGGYAVIYYRPKETLLSDPAPDRDARVARDEQPK